MTTVLCVPQWQGSAAESARFLKAGAHRTAELMPADEVRVVPVRDDTTDLVDGVRALDVLVDNLRLTRETLATIDDFVITAGGECAVDLAPVEAASRRYGDELTLLWIDANPDCYGPGDLRSGAFHAMIVRTLLGDGPTALTPGRLLRPEQVILAGVREVDDCEREYMVKTGLRAYGVDRLEEAFSQVSGPIYVHVDLDSLDPAEFASVGYRYPGGVSPGQLIELLSRLDNVVGAAITEHAPRGENAAEADIIRRLGAALRRGL
ncbi:arginase family protein [Fodinicola acaciae]|uniref:arginase family protein n=1 Tax=Fodinicola acaciae TaxID=2681555 RepID=UPI0013D08E20|nr:arginase family protein [Fodinicola acaciae]